MGNTARIFTVIAGVFILGSPSLANALSYPVSEEHWQITEKGVMRPGTTAYLFQSGTPDVKKAIEAGAILIVYGERGGETKAVGKIRVHAYLGKYYAEGEVIEGEVRHDDVATKGGASCLVIFQGEMLK